MKALDLALLCLMPLVRRSIGLLQGAVDDLAHQEAEDKEDEHRPRQTRQKDHDAVDIDVRRLIAGFIRSVAVRIVLGADGLRCGR